MASGKQHAAASVIIASTMILPAILFYIPGLFISLGCFLGVILTPDLDVESPVHSHYTVGKIGKYAGDIFGFILKWIWRVFWYPYSIFIPKHRHWISHAPILGTFSRLIYIAVFFVPLVILAPEILHIFYNWYFIYLVFGLIISDVAHWIMDGFPIYR